MTNQGGPLVTVLAFQDIAHVVFRRNWADVLPVWREATAKNPSFVLKLSDLPAADSLVDIANPPFCRLRSEWRR